MILTIEQAESLADATLRAIAACHERLRPEPLDRESRAEFAADWERVFSDIAGLRDCWDAYRERHYDKRHATRYSDGLIRTAALYGVTL